MTRKTSAKVIELNKPILEEIRIIKSQHPFWGYRRVWAYLCYHKSMVVNKKRIYKLMKENELLVKERRSIKAKRTPERSKPKATRPNEIWGIDMTKVKTERGWAYLVFTIDWCTKKIVGHSVSDRSKTCDWLEAIERGIVSQYENGSRDQGLKLVSDNGCQPTSEKFMKSCNLLGIRQIFTSFNNPKGNADTERLMRTCKEELIWLKEWADIQEVSKAVDKWVSDYNESYLHSALGYKPPSKYEKSFMEKKVA